MKKIVDIDLLRRAVNNKDELLALSADELADALFLLSRNNSSNYFQQGQFESLQDSIKFAWSKASSDKRDAREERTLAIAEEANSIAKDALAIAKRDERWAMWATIIATFAMITASKDILISLIL